MEAVCPFGYHPPGNTFLPGIGAVADRLHDPPLEKWAESATLGLITTA